MSWIGAGEGAPELWIVQSVALLQDGRLVYNRGHNNGRVTQTIDNVLGETVNYTYDYLHR